MNWIELWHSEGIANSVKSIFSFGIIWLFPGAETVGSGPYLEFLSNFCFFLFFFAMPYFGRLGQCPEIRQVDNLHEWVPFVTVAQSSTVSCLVGSKPSLIKHLKALNQLVWRLPLRWKNALDWKICSISIFSEIFSPCKHVLAALFRK